MDTQDREIKPLKESEVTAVKPPRKKNLFSILIVVLIVVLFLVILFGKDILLKPDDAVAYYNRGVDYQAIGDLDRAITDYDKAIQLKPDFTKAYYSRGLAYATKGDKQSASADFKKTLELCGNSTLCQDAQQQLDTFGLK